MVEQICANSRSITLIYHIFDTYHYNSTALTFLTHCCVSFPAGYQLLYLTSRAIGQANITRGYISSLKQGESSLPLGPVIMSPDRLLHSFKREVIHRRPQGEPPHTTHVVQQPHPRHP